MVESISVQAQADTLSQISIANAAFGGPPSLGTVKKKSELLGKPSI